MIIDQAKFTDVFNLLRKKIVFPEATRTLVPRHRSNFSESFILYRFFFKVLYIFEGNQVW